MALIAPLKSAVSNASDWKVADFQLLESSSTHICRPAPRFRKIIVRRQMRQRKKGGSGGRREEVEEEGRNVKEEGRNVKEEGRNVKEEGRNVKEEGRKRRKKGGSGGRRRRDKTRNYSQPSTEERLQIHLGPILQPAHFYPDSQIFRHCYHLIACVMRRRH